jgi:hypothetical protein
MMMEAIRRSEASVLKRTTRHNIPEHGILPNNALSDFIAVGKFFST